MNSTDNNIEIPDYVKPLWDRGTDTWKAIYRKIVKRGGNTLLLGVHGGKMHADDVLCAAILMDAFPFAELKVHRTYDHAFLMNCDVVCDIPCEGHDMVFDHHTGDIEFYSNKIPMASCGKLLRALEPDTNLLHRLRQRLLFAVEAADNGYSTFMPLDDIYKNNKLSFVSCLNPTARMVENGEKVFGSVELAQYDDEDQRDAEVFNRMSYAAFMSALTVVADIYRIIKSECMSSDYYDGLLDCASHHQDSEGNKWLAVPKMWIPYKGWLAIHGFAGAFYHDVVKNCWTVWTRCAFPAEWGGRINEDLEKVSGIPGALFCHHGGFIATFATLEAAKKAMDAVSKTWKE